ncbi:phage terminase large subunit [Geothrix fuzhouensis]|uniref:phage terminase large subunit n=1 Tax=Geothrix fuzhouensis TaxID=2966451 RepID=UPI0021493706|nr:phage terminase large subunit [Geothrix fuzhouensis]
MTGPRVHIPKATAAKARRKTEELEQLIARLREMEDFPPDARTAQAARARRQAAQAKFQTFCKNYLPDLIQGEGCVLHDAIATGCQALGDGKPAPVRDPGPFGEVVLAADDALEAAEIHAMATAAPRGHAKSTWGTLAFSAWVILTGRKGYVQVVSDTQDQAKGFIEAVRTLMEESPRIRCDFGQIETEGPEGLIDLVVPAGPAGEKAAFRLARLQAFGSGQRLRGRTFQGRRPDLIILDDVENDEAVENPDRRKKLRRWFIKAVLPALDPSCGALAVWGTILHEDSLLCSVLRMFGGAIWRCWDEQETPLWPERFPAGHLRWLRSTMDAEDPGSFAQEMENRAQGDDEKPFKAFQEYDRLPERLEILTHVDPATGKRRGDYTALVTVGYANGICYVLDAVIKRIGATLTGKAILAQREAYPGKVQSEDVAYQESLAEIVGLLSAEEGILVPIALVKPKGDKVARIESMAPHIETGRILFPQLSPMAKGNGNLQPCLVGGASGIRKLQAQLLQFPKGANDDGPDALQGAVAGRWKKKPFAGAGLGLKPSRESFEVRL